MSIFLGLDSEARELRAEMEVFHSFRALTGRGHNVLRERPREYSGLHNVIFEQGVGACKTTSASYVSIVSNQLLYRDPMPLSIK